LPEGRLVAMNCVKIRVVLPWTFELDKFWTSRGKLVFGKTTWISVESGGFSSSAEYRKRNLTEVIIGSKKVRFSLLRTTCVSLRQKTFEGQGRRGLTPGGMKWNNKNDPITSAFFHSNGVNGSSCSRKEEDTICSMLLHIVESACSWLWLEMNSFHSTWRRTDGRLSGTCPKKKPISLQ